MESDIEPIKAELERAYARLRSTPPGDETEPLLLEIERQLNRDRQACGGEVLQRTSRRLPS